MHGELDANTDVIVQRIVVAYRREKIHPWKHMPTQKKRTDNCYGLMYIQQGGFCHSTERQERIHIPCDSLVLVKYGETYTNSSAELPFHYLAVDLVTAKPLPLDFGGTDYMLFSREDIPQAEEKMTAAYRLFTERLFGWKIRLRGLMEELLLAVLRVCYEDRRDALPPLIASASAVIRRRIFTELLSVESVAQECGVTASHLIRSFRRYLGVTPKQYMNRMRVNMARELLRYSGKSIEEIAALAGFSEARQMRRVFREIEGIPPGEYRRRT